ncbi:thiol peroxidase [Pseudomonas aeruginosa]|nr:thiol peroxidase [Pseudomonas aeruginosa]
MAQVTLKGNPVNVDGQLPQERRPGSGLQPGRRRPRRRDPGKLRRQAQGAEHLPQRRHPTCATSVRKFNVEAGKLANTVVLCISADLPFAQKRFCGAEGLENVVNLSTLRGREFLENYGVAIASGPLAGLAARAVVVLDEQNKVLHSELVGEIADEPNYAAALAAL